MDNISVGGRQRVVLQLALAGRQAGDEHSLLLYDCGFRNDDVDLNPGEVPVSLLRRRSGLDAGFAGLLARHVVRERITVVHAHGDTAAFYGCTAAVMVGNDHPRVVITFHGYPRHATRLGKLATRFMARRAASVTAVSAELASRLPADGWVDSCVCIHNGVDLEEFTPAGPLGGWRRMFRIPEGALVVGHIGRCDEWKRQIDLLAAMRIVAQSGDDIHLLLVGDGPLRLHLLNSAKHMRTVHFVPRVHDVPAFLRELDCFVLCSDREGMPRVLLEAMATGLPCITTTVGDVASILRCLSGESCGLLIPPRRPDLLASAIRSLLHDTIQRTRFGELAREKVAEFGLDHMRRQYEALYDSAH